jgi:hypothetical protein
LIRVKIPGVLTNPAEKPRALKYLTEYFATYPLDTQDVPEGRYTGSHFERFGGDRRKTDKDIFSADDVVSLSLLSVRLKGHAVLHLLDADNARLSALLAQVPADVDLVDVPLADIKSGWPAWDLYEALKKIKGIGTTSASKLLARKRPRLIPIRDADVTRSLDLGKGDFWKPLAEALRTPGFGAGGGTLHDYLLELREASDIGDDISPLRVFDVVVWRDAQDGVGGRTVTKPPGR